jgi:hypothetical protein
LRSTDDDARVVLSQNYNFSFSVVMGIKKSTTANGIQAWNATPHTLKSSVQTLHKAAYAAFLS